MMLQKTFAAIFCLCCLSVANAQTTQFTFQGNLTVAGVPANGNFDFDFALFDSLSSGTQLGPTISRNAVVIANGSFAVELDFGSQFPGANRYLEIRVRNSGGGVFTPLVPRQQVNSSPYSIKSTSAENAATATTAANASQLGGVAANQYVVTTDARMTNARTPTAGSNNYIQNGMNQQIADFNIGGNGIVGSSLGIGTSSLAARLSVSTNTSGPGTNTAYFAAPNIGPNVSHIHWGNTGDWYIRSAFSSGKVVLQDSGGNVGIGTSAPSTKLHLSGTGVVRTRVNSDSNAGLSLSLSEASKWSVATVTGGQFQIFNDAIGQNALWIDSASNNVGIGTISPTEKLSVAGSVGFTGSLKLNGSEGSAGQVLTSNGPAAPAQWSSPTNPLYNNTFLNVSTGTITGSPTPVLIPGLTQTINVPSNAKLVVQFDVMVDARGCSPCFGQSRTGIYVTLNGVVQNWVVHDVGMGAMANISGSWLINVGSGSHTVEIKGASVEGSPISIGYSCNGCNPPIRSSMLVQTIPQ